MAIKCRNLQLLLLLVVFPATARKYVQVPLQQTWSGAQLLCKTSYTDLAPVSNDYDRGLLNTPRSWFGLMRNSTDRTKWQWSGGAAVTKFFWGPNEPNGQDNGEDVAMMDNNGWYDVGASRLYPFICYKVHAIRKRMTWYDALRYCRQNHGDLASVASETEMMLIKHELSKELSTQNVWTGLQYLVDSWQWMDGQPFSYESWGPDPKPTCPDIHWACGALRVEGQSQDSLTKVQGVAGWNALYCNQTLHFLCY